MRESSGPPREGRPGILWERKEAETVTRVAIMGCGKLGTIIAEALRDNRVPDCRLAGVMGRGAERAARVAAECGCKACGSVGELLALKPDYLIEAATAQALRDCAREGLNTGCSLICLSVGAFADQTFYDQTARAAREHHAKVYLAPGVIGGFDIASTLSAMGELRGTFIKFKAPNDSGRCPPGLMELPDAFDGSVREGFQSSPRHLNVAVAAALACGGLDETRMRVVPALAEDAPSFGLDLEGCLAGASLRVWQGGFAGREPGPALAAWSVVALLRRLTSPISFA